MAVLLLVVIQVATDGDGPVHSDKLAPLQVLLGSELSQPAVEGLKQQPQFSDLLAGFPEDMLKAMDVEADPCDDFYTFACGKWDAEHKAELAANEYKSQMAMEWDVAIRTTRDEELKMLAEDQGTAGMMYRSCMDVDHIEELGGKPLKPWLALIDSIQDMDSLASTVAIFNLHEIHNLFSWSIGKGELDIQCAWHC